jgi:hypothetical protein
MDIDRAQKSYCRQFNFNPTQADRLIFNNSDGQLKLNLMSKLKTCQEYIKKLTGLKSEQCFKQLASKELLLIKSTDLPQLQNLPDLNLKTTKLKIQPGCKYSTTQYETCLLHFVENQKVYFVMASSQFTDIVTIKKEYFKICQRIHT